MHWTMELYLFLSLVNVADAVILRFIPKRRPIARFVCKSILFAIETVLLVALVRSPLHPVYRPQDLPRMFWIQVLISCWWVLAARELVSLLALMTALRRSAVENKLLSNIISVSIYLCAGLAILGFVFEFPILDHPPASVAAADFKADRITYDVNFST